MNIDFLKKTVILVYWSIVLGGVYFVLTISHKEVVDFVFASVGKAFGNEFVERYLPVRSFTIGRSIIAVLLLLLAAMLFYFQSALRLQIGLFYVYCKRAIASLTNCLQSDIQTADNKRLFFAIIPIGIFLFQLFLAAIWPFQYDEAWSYNYHIGNNFFASFLLPNNHIFYTIVAYFFNKLPFPHEVSVRLPLILGSFFAFIFFYYFLRQHVGKRTAWIGALFFYSSCPVTFYSFYARGYLFVILFAILFLVASYKWLVSQCLNRQALILLSIAFILSVYSVLTAVYFFIPSYMVLVWECYKVNKSKMKTLMLSIGVCIFILLLLNTPSLISGHGANLAKVAQGQITLDVPFFKLYLFANEYFMLGTKAFGGALYLFTFVIIVVLFRFTERRKSYPLSICFLGFAMPFFFLYVQKVFLAERIVVHFIIYFSIVFALLIQQVAKYLDFKMFRVVNHWLFLFLFSALLVTINLHAALNHHYFNWSLDSDKSIKKMATVMKQRGIDSLYLFADYAKPGIQYYYKIDQMAITLLMPQVGSLDYSKYDSTQLYPSIIWETDRPVPVKTDRYRIIHKDERFTLALPESLNGSNR